jgi:hypothetical protein
MRRVSESVNQDDVRLIDWKESPGDVLEVVDDQLAEYGLEVIIIDLGGDTYVWRIEKRRI